MERMPDVKTKGNSVWDREHAPNSTHSEERSVRMLTGTDWSQQQRRGSGENALVLRIPYPAICSQIFRNLLQMKTGRKKPKGQFQAHTM